MKTESNSYLSTQQIANEVKPNAQEQNNINKGYIPKQGNPYTPNKTFTNWKISVVPIIPELKTSKSDAVSKSISISEAEHDSLKVTDHILQELLDNVDWSKSGSKLQASYNKVLKPFLKNDRHLQVKYFFPKFDDTSLVPLKKQYKNNELRVLVAGAKATSQELLDQLESQSKGKQAVNNLKSSEFTVSRDQKTKKKQKLQSTLYRKVDSSDIQQSAQLTVTSAARSQRPTIEVMHNTGEEINDLPHNNVQSGNLYLGMPAHDDGGEQGSLSYPDLGDAENIYEQPIDGFGGDNTKAIPARRRRPNDQLPPIPTNEEYDRDSPLPLLPGEIPVENPLNGSYREEIDNNDPDYEEIDRGEQGSLSYLDVGDTDNIYEQPIDGFGGDRDNSKAIPARRRTPNDPLPPIPTNEEYDRDSPLPLLPGEIPVENLYEEIDQHQALDKKDIPDSPSENLYEEIDQYQSQDKTNVTDLPSEDYKMNKKK